MVNNFFKLGGYLLLAREAADFLVNSREDRDRERRRKSAAWAVSSSLLGITMGVAAGILMAPRAGKETREIIASTASEKVKSLQEALAEKRRQFAEIVSRQKEELCEESEEILEKAAG